MSELQGLQSEITAIRNANTRVFGVSVDSVAENAKVVEKLGLDFALLSDPKLNAIDAFGLRHEGASINGADIARPAVFIINGDGNVAWRDLTDTYRVRVRPKTVLEQLAKL